ncbi:MAG: sigma-70 family RNA polymerase sigma factor, partial [Propionibacterium sp.]|nr:sigma-70 family RNA polymerase sigma factor [Propionibacterium sp.]
ALRVPTPPNEPEDALVLREALGRLSSNDQEILTLTYWDGLASAEVALVLGVSAPAVRRRLSRARERLRRQFAPHEAPSSHHELTPRVPRRADT